MSAEVLNTAPRAPMSTPNAEKGPPARRRSTMHCDACGKDTVIEIRLEISGENVTFQRCGFCEAKSWDVEDTGALSLEGVLDLARTAG